VSSVINRVRGDKSTEPEMLEPSGPIELTPWDRVKLARHADRPHTLDYIEQLMREFTELHGDRSFGDDQALIGGLGKFGERTVLVLGHQKGKGTQDNIKRNFGMARPEGYRKAERLMRHAEKFGIPIVTFIDTPGAEPGIGSEERGQSTAIAECLLTMAGLETPIVAVIIGEGGSGGALAIGVADRVLMLENAIYSVASPEASATILWKDVSKASEAATSMKITAPALLAYGLVDAIIPEEKPAHETPDAVIAATGAAVEASLGELEAMAGKRNGAATLVRKRFEKFRAMGVWTEGE
jgi:acetyl-CoA carboxylase carboxyl transferase subunit alpha